VLEKAGLSTETDGGVTDEGEPWLVFSDAESDEVIAHVAHISGTYVVCAPILTGALTGSNLADLMKCFLQCWVGAQPRASGNARIDNGALLGPVTASTDFLQSV
jgi:hypothetical protein